MSEPVDLAAEREARRPPEGNLKCLSCGSEWFNASVIISAADNRVGGYSPPMCSNCEEPLYPDLV